ncbi:MAG: accessory factor UbiK family protein [Gammaproteobacteria bacterium]|nr:accessory factor UbiK family protein [Gammaproteobacteria bacterium]
MKLQMRLVDGLIKLVDGLKEGSKPLLQGVLKSALGKMDLVTREEFDAQRRVLEKADRTLAALQTRLEACQNKSDSDIS